MTDQLTSAELGKVLGVWAHPDDEAFLTTGLAGRIMDAGGTVACVTATRGELGSPDPSTWTPERLGRRRADELRASLAVVGITDHEFLGYLDGSLHEVATDEGTAVVQAIIERVRPDTVVTFGPDGMTGHADHVAVSRWTTRACARVDREPRLLYAAATSVTTSRWGAVNDQINAFDPDQVARVVPDEEVALRLALDTAEVDRKIVALCAQSSQIGPLVTALGEDTLRSLVDEEAFRLGPIP